MPQLYDLPSVVQENCQPCKFRIRQLKNTYTLIEEHPGCQVKQIAHFLGHSIQNTHRLLNLLVAANLIIKENIGDPTGGKLYQYTINRYDP